MSNNPGAETARLKSDQNRVTRFNHRRAGSHWKSADHKAGNFSCWNIAAFPRKKDTPSTGSDRKIAGSRGMLVPRLNWGWLVVCIPPLVQPRRSSLIKAATFGARQFNSADFKGRSYDLPSLFVTPILPVLSPISCTSFHSIHFFFLFHLFIYFDCVFPMVLTAYIIKDETDEDEWLVGGQWNDSSIHVNIVLENIKFPGCFDHPLWTWCFYSENCMIFLAFRTLELFNRALIKHRSRIKFCSSVDRFEKYRDTGPFHWTSKFFNPFLIFFHEKGMECSKWNRVRTRTFVSLNYKCNGVCLFFFVCLNSSYFHDNLQVYWSRGRLTVSA